MTQKYTYFEGNTWKGTLEGNTYQPKPHIATKDVNGRKFLFKWYGEFQWLEYSPYLDHAFCFPCKIFGRIGRYEETIVSASFRKWKDAIDKFRKHQCTAVHITAMERWSFGKQAHKNPEQDIRRQINHQYEKEVTENHEYLTEIINTIIFLTRQNISMRGHNESDTSLYKGDFLELLQLRSKDNEVLKRIFLNKEKKVTLIVPHVQNKLIEIMAQIVRENLFCFNFR